MKAFFQWLAMQSGYKSRISYTDTEYFNLSEKEVRIATARREAAVPTLEQIKHVIETMPNNSAIKRRNRSLIGNYNYGMLNKINMVEMKNFSFCYFFPQTLPI